MANEQSNLMLHNVFPFPISTLITSFLTPTLDINLEIDQTSIEQNTHELSTTYLSSTISDSKG